MTPHRPLPTPHSPLRTLLALLLLLAATTATAQPSPDRGFIHPGGLHTQADFDRVKAQLADGNATVKAAYQKLTSAAYAQASVQTYPVETIVRGGGTGENYINACRGAAMAYQNALRWKIAGTKANADAAVRILMAWAATTRDIGGDSNYALASGLYGYQFAQAAELMRDYEGWAREDFETFRQWMLAVWYPKAIGFLRGRNGTWENADKWWQAPGHYWSNWGLCNALCVSLIGILCDDVFIYNQGMSYFKYDQCGTYTDVRTEVPIRNDGLTEFLGNLVVTTAESPLETGAYGRLGQMNESGRDTGHSAMALGLAVDLAKVGWSQGDDLFAYMDHRLAAGIEYVAAQTQSVEGLPWTNYAYGTNGIYYTDSRTWVMTGPALGAQMRPYWGTVIGVYEGVKGVRMPFSEVSYTTMGIDEGGQGATSGGYDHLGYSVLMNTRTEQLCPAEGVPTELTPRMEYSGTLTTNLVPSLAQERTRGNIVGKVLAHNELGGLVNTFAVNNATCLPAGQTVRLMPQLPEGEEDTGLWRWDTGETTRELTVGTDRSHIYRVHYTNQRGVESQLSFALAVSGDCTPDRLAPSITYGGTTTADTTVTVLYGKAATLSVAPDRGWGTYRWSTGATTQSITTRTVTADTQYTVEFRNQGGAVTTQVFDVRMAAAEPYVSVGGTRQAATEAVVDAGAEVTLGLTLPAAVGASRVTWSDGSTGATLTLPGVQTSATCSATFDLRGETYTFDFHVLVKDAEASRLLEPGNYVLRHVGTDTYLTAHGRNELATFEPLDADSAAQVWLLDRRTTAKYNLLSLPDSLKLGNNGRTSTAVYYPFQLHGAQGTDRYALYTGTGSATKFWDVDADGTILTAARTTLTAFPFELIPVGTPTGITDIYRFTDSPFTEDPSDNEKSNGQSVNDNWYDLSGRPHSPLRTPHSPLLHGGKKILMK